jgi:hypothetical protein
VGAGVKEHVSLGVLDEEYGHWGIDKRILVNPRDDR